VEEAAKTLSELGFVPAVLIHLAWVGAAPSLGEGNIIGGYLKDEVRDTAGGSGAEGEVRPVEALYPTGEPLVARPLHGEVRVGGMAAADIEADLEKKEEKKKPKWFKM
jgi:hypothetical protein